MMKTEDDIVCGDDAKLIKKQQENIAVNNNDNNNEEDHENEDLYASFSGDANADTSKQNNIKEVSLINNIQSFEIENGSPVQIKNEVHDNIKNQIHDNKLLFSFKHKILLYIAIVLALYASIISTYLLLLNLSSNNMMQSEFSGITEFPTNSPIVSNTSIDTSLPSKAQIVNPSPTTMDPTLEPTASQIRIPTINPSSPTTINPTSGSTASPTRIPTINPSSPATMDPTLEPTFNPMTPTTDSSFFERNTIWINNGTWTTSPGDHPEYSTDQYVVSLSGKITWGDSTVAMGSMGPGSGYIGLLPLERAPPYDMVFSVTNTNGLTAKIIITNTGEIYLRAWSISLLYYNALYGIFIYPDDIKSFDNNVFLRSDLIMNSYDTLSDILITVNLVDFFSIELDGIVYVLPQNRVECVGC